MKSVRHIRTNLDLGKPVDWDQERDGTCKSLPVIYDADQRTFFSYWRPSFREWVLLVLGRPIRLGIMGGSHPPVSIDTART